MAPNFRIAAATHLVAPLVALALLLPRADLQAQDEPAFVDYCARLEQEIQGRKHGFLAGNLTYYVGGFHASWKLVEHETLGLTHPFHHDLRSRGVGLLESELNGPENTGIGNDYSGWEFYKDTRVLYGSVIIDGVIHKHPKPTSMRWRPDRMICEYEVAGIRLKEVKFIAAKDVVISFITSSKPVQLQFSGNSFNHRNSVSSSAKIEFDASRELHPHFRKWPSPLATRSSRQRTHWSMRLQRNDLRIKRFTNYPCTKIERRREGGSTLSIHGAL